ncbi:MAG: trypsin-like peptidase domain-containing protein [Jatrophihabitantaceae bacterium]
MRPRRFAGLLARSIAGLLVLITPTAAGAATSPPGRTGIGQAVHVPGLPTVGPLFRNGLQQPHECTASVLLSPGHDLILTAAHCLHGSGAGLRFAPGYDRGRTPYGVWTTSQAYVDPSWISRQDPQHDYAIVRVAHQTRHGQRVGIQDVVGGGNLLALAPQPGQPLTVPAYPAGINDQPIDCAVTDYDTNGYPSFDCGGYVGGTSGAAWLIRTAIPHVSLVAGVIGGLHQGGCVDYTSYSSAFSLDTYRLWLRAALGARPDTVPAAGSDGC